MIRPLRHALPLLVALFVLACPRASLAQGAPPDGRSVDPDSTRAAAAALWDLVRDHVRQHGGDLDRQHVHLAVGFSTGHFSSDPLGAQALRSVANHLLAQLVRGDRLSVFAWEMDLWDNPEGRGSPFQVPADLGPDKDQLQSHWPLTPRTATEGGHDTEHALVQITDRLADDLSAVIVLLTNSAASNSPFSGGRVIGADDPSYQAVLTRWDRLPQVSKSGASATLPFTVLTPGLGPESRFADAVVLLPRGFSGQAIDGARAERLSAAAPTPPISPTPAPGPEAPPSDSFARLLPVLLGLLVVAALALAGLAAARSGAFASLQSPRLVLVLGGRRFALADLQPEEVICHLAGPSFTSEGGGEVVIRQDAPPGVRVAAFHKARGAVHVRAAPDFECHDAGGASGDLLLKMGKHTLRFTGALPRPGMPVDHYSLEVEVDLAPEGA